MIIAFDTETTGLHHVTDKVFGFSLSFEDGLDEYHDIRLDPNSIHRANRIFRDADTIVAHNLSFDYRFATMAGFKLPLDKCVDTCILACLLNEHEVSYSLDNLAKKYTKVRKKGDELYQELARIFGGRATRNVQMRRISDAPHELVGEYAKSDTRATLELYLYQRRQIKEQRIDSIVNFERQITPALIAAEMHGVRVDLDAAEKAKKVLESELASKQKQLDEIAGFHCNFQPSKDTAKLFNPQFRDGQYWAGKDLIPATDSGAPSFAADVLRSMSHPAASLLLEMRSLEKTRGTFIDGHVLGSAVNGRVYPNINQTKGEDGGTATGRLSYTSPALQQIPDRNKKVAEIVKSVFLPDEGHDWIDADLASFEVRIFAHLVGTPDIVEQFKKNPETDFHQYVADLTGLVRNATYNGQPNAKQLNLSMIFNQGNGQTADKMGMPWEWSSFTTRNGEEVTYKKPGLEALSIIEQYHRRLPGVKKLAEGAKSVAEQRGYIFTRRGRRIRFPNGFKSYKASGLLIQSTAADENKQNWLVINEAIKGTGAKLLLNTHDSYSLSVPKSCVEFVAKRAKEAVEEDRGLKVPLILEVNMPGNNWWESKRSERWM